MADVDTLTAWIQDEQASLWGDFATAIERAMNDVWSMECEWLACRLIRAIWLVGPHDPGDLTWSILAGGIYQAVLERAGVPLPDGYGDMLTEYEPSMVAHHQGKRIAEFMLERAATCEEIRTGSWWESFDMDDDRPVTP